MSVDLTKPSPTSAAVSAVQEPSDKLGSEKALTELKLSKIDERLRLVLARQDFFAAEKELSSVQKEELEQVVNEKNSLKQQKENLKQQQTALLLKYAEASLKTEQIVKEQLLAKEQAQSLKKYATDHKVSDTNHSLILSIIETLQHSFRGKSNTSGSELYPHILNFINTIPLDPQNRKTCVGAIIERLHSSESKFCPPIYTSPIYIYFGDRLYGFPDLNPSYVPHNVLAHEMITWGPKPEEGMLWVAENHSPTHVMTRYSREPIKFIKVQKNTKIGMYFTAVRTLQAFLEKKLLPPQSTTLGRLIKIRDSEASTLEEICKAKALLEQEQRAISEKVKKIKALRKQLKEQKKILISEKEISGKELSEKESAFIAAKTQKKDNSKCRIKRFLDDLKDERESLYYSYAQNVRKNAALEEAKGKSECSVSVLNARIKEREELTTT